MLAFSAMAVSNSSIDGVSPPVGSWEMDTTELPFEPSGSVGVWKDTIRPPKPQFTPQGFLSQLGAFFNGVAGPLDL